MGGKEPNSFIKWLKDFQNSASTWAGKQGAAAKEMGSIFGEVTEEARNHITGTLKPLYKVYGSMGGFGATPTAFDNSVKELKNIIP